MRKYRIFILIAAVVLSALAAYGIFTAPRVEPTNSERFSAERVADDIKVISRKPHSIIHPKERAEVRDYLGDRLIALTDSSVIFYPYENATEYEGIPIDITNIFAQVDPIIDDPDHPDPTYLMLMAHYDSRYPQKVLNETVLSYGAADDGYGCGVALESLKQALRYRGEWRQGIKILLTDSEEWKLAGINSALEHNPEIFDNVGLIINLESRGNKGPVLLFETGKNNSKVLSLYKKAKAPYTYTFTTVVYEFMPNFTDFTPLKDSYPGMNFSNLDDINHYHTDLDNYDNISLHTIQHFGAQLEPIIEEYLTNHEYRDPEALVSDKSSVAFTIPAIGLLSFSKGGYLLANSIVLALFCLIFSFALISSRIRPLKVLVASAKVLLWALVAFAIGELIAWVVSLIVGAKFSFMGVVRGVQFDEWVMIGTAVVTALIVAICFFFGRKKASDRISSTAIRKSAAASGATKYSYNLLYGTMLLLLLLSAILLFTIGENFFFVLPLALAAASVFLWRITTWRGWLLVAIVVTLLHAFSFLYIVIIALTMGALGVLPLFMVIYLALLLPLADLYTRKEKTI
ncbi:MAG: M28 family peptidase [Bacteroidales bacterium]|jgi:hypothetical protein|nr:M28 family peptidase [Bacteroidales bacterium]HPH53611.1 M28 family peptidase [Bacteroidales bacterium]